MAKLDVVIAAADIQPTDHVLEIGCGWGSFAMRAASTTGCRCEHGAAQTGIASTVPFTNSSSSGVAVRFWYGWSMHSSHSMSLWLGAHDSGVSVWCYLLQGDWADAVQGAAG
jgi:hypothetical protein